VRKLLLVITVILLMGCGKGADDHMQDGYAQLRKGDMASAVLEFEKAVEAEPDNPEARNALGTALSALGDFNRALEHFRAAVATDDEFIEGHYNLARALSELGRFEEALAEFKITAQLDPGYALAYMGAGDVFAAGSAVDLAIESYQLAIAADPELLAAYMRLASIYVGTGEYNKGIDLLLDARAFQPGNSEIISMAGRAAIAKRDFGQAVDLLQQAVEMDTLHLLNRNDLATALMLSEREDEAVAVWTGILKLNPPPELEQVVLQNLERARVE
jgi:tetratricopeptide (TPR) repeat protein